MSCNLAARARSDAVKTAWTVQSDANKLGVTAIESLYHGTFEL